MYRAAQVGPKFLLGPPPPCDTSCASRGVPLLVPAQRHAARRKSHSVFEPAPLAAETATMRCLRERPPYPTVRPHAFRVSASRSSPFSVTLSLRSIKTRFRALRFQVSKATKNSMHNMRWQRHLASGICAGHVPDTRIRVQRSWRALQRFRRNQTITGCQNESIA